MPATVMGKYCKHADYLRLDKQTQLAQIGMSIGFESGTPRQFIQANILDMTPTTVQIDRQGLQATPNDKLQTVTRCLWIMPENQQINTPQATISVEEEESSDDDPSPPAKRRKRETAAERLEAAVDRRIKELGNPVDQAAVKAVVQAEFIVRNKMRPHGKNGNQNEFKLYRGSKVCHYVDNVNLSTGWFDEFKVLPSHNALTARGQVDTYGSKLQKSFNGKRLKSRIVFFTRQHRDDATMRSEFEGIVEDYTDIPFSYGLDEVVLVHMSDVNVDEHDASLKVIARSPCKLQSDIAWTEEEVGV
ncbi:hypothetical protein TrLO_g2260 [Triparma laevis f. longispina]|uniref:Uncharacterized protein n=1 Tax=Triparma laevis f. longispina TaxID=1714387 RepID=A0A9W7C8S2_9STRA|nr:hypothetical protein TrLO_g2260 [Triparma laevis f. longispina]